MTSNEKEWSHKEADIAFNGTNTAKNGGIVELNSQRIIAYRPEISRYFGGSPLTAIYFQQLYHWQQFARSTDGFFYKTAKEMYEETDITPMKQRKCREELELAGWIKTEKKMANGSPTLHFKVLISLQTVVNPFVKITNGNVENNKSITIEDNTRKKYMSNLTDEQKRDILLVYRNWLAYMVVDPATRLHGTTDEQATAIEEAKKRYRLTPKRREAIKHRLDDAGYDMLVRAISNLGRAGSFYRGDNDRDWKADLADFLCRSYEKVEEWANKNEKEGN